MAKFIREFNVEARANAFARKVKGVVCARYDWDNWTNRMIKVWIVRY